MRVLASKLFTIYSARRHSAIATARTETTAHICLTRSVDLVTVHCLRTQYDFISIDGKGLEVLLPSTVQDRAAVIGTNGTSDLLADQWRI